MWRYYKNCCQARNAAALALRPVAYRTFCRLWADLLPHIKISKPRSDLCWVCHQNSTTIMKVANKPDDDKAKVVHTRIFEFKEIRALVVTNKF